MYLLTYLLSLANSSTRVPNAYSFSRKWLLPIKGDHKGKSTSPVHSARRLLSKVIIYNIYVYISRAISVKANLFQASNFFRGPISFPEQFSFKKVGNLKTKLTTVTLGTRYVSFYVSFTS